MLLSPLVVIEDMKIKGALVGARIHGTLSNFQKLELI